MAKTVTKLYSNGTFAVNGSFDEVTKVINSIDSNTVYSALFDEYTINAGAVAMRKTSGGSLLIGGIFDEYTLTPSSGGSGDTNLQFNVTAGTLTGTFIIEHTFGSDGSVTSTSGVGDGTWYNGTPTGSNFEIQIAVTSWAGSDVAFESDSFSSTGTSSWYTLNTARILGLQFDGSTTIEVRIREIAVPSNIITKSFDYVLSS